jgi:nucleotide-binding universal stress UspA family protein
MTQDHIESVIQSAPHSQMHAVTPLHPKTLTVFLDASPAGARRAAHAVALARRWGAHLVGVHIIQSNAPPHPWDCYAVGEKAIGQVIELGRKLHADGEAAAKVLAEQFKALCSKMNVAGEFRVIDEAEPAREAILHSLHSDLVVVGHPEPHGLPDGMAQEGLLASGAPLLVIPNEWRGDAIGDHVLVAWNASREARRAVSDAMSLLTAAKSVTVLVIDGAERRSHGQEPGVDLALQLARHGVHVDVVGKKSNGSPIAELILAGAAEAGADLLVFGAYSHARSRELVFGGATRTLLERMPLPVFVSR